MPEIDLDIEKGFAIIHSTKDYNAALKTVKEASKKLDIKIDLRGYYADGEGGLVTDVVCGCGLDHDTYNPRGRFDDGAYISIEKSRYRGFTEGYYIVVVASGNKGDKVLTETLKTAKKHYPDAYIKNTTIWYGCSH